MGKLIKENERVKIDFFLMVMSFLLLMINLITYKLIGVQIDKNGFVNEPFYLIPLCWFLGGTTIVSGIIFLIRINKEKSKEIE